MSAEIRELQVHDGYIAARLLSASEIRLDGWKRWRPVSEFSWIDPWLILGTTEKPLAPGARTLSVRDGFGVVASADFTMPGAPEPEPEPEKWAMIRDLRTVADWDGKLDRAPGSRIVDTPEGIELYQPNRGERCELQVDDDRLAEGARFRLRFALWIDPITVIDPTGSGTDTVAQAHGNKDPVTRQTSGYGGGLTVRASDRMLILRVKGGKLLDPRGAHRYEYESDGNGGGADGKGDDVVEPPERVECGVVTFGEWHEVTYELALSKTWDGAARVTLDGKTTVCDGVPTMCEPATVELMRVGWYSSDGPVPKRMTVRGCKVEVLG